MNILNKTNEKEIYNKLKENFKKLNEKDLFKLEIENHVSNHGDFDNGVVFAFKNHTLSVYLELFELPYDHTYTDSELVEILDEICDILNDVQADFDYDYDIKINYEIQIF